MIVPTSPPAASAAGDGPTPVHTASRVAVRSRARSMAIAATLLGLCASNSAAEYTLVWSDELDGTEVDPTKWEFQIGTGCPDLCGWGNDELQYYRAENSTVADGVLTITAKEESFGGRDYTSSRLRTRGLGDWTTGRFEMRAKLPVGQGIWPAFWMLPTDSPYGGWPVSGEIDIMEYLGQDPDRTFGTLHYGDPGHRYATTDHTLPEGTFDDGFHVFALEWEPHEMRWYVDGVQYACNSFWTSSGGPYPAPFDHDFHLLLNMAVGGNLPGPPDDTTEFPQEYVIDYVRVYQKPEHPDRGVLFDGMDHGDPYGNGWWSEGGGGGGGIGASAVDLPPGDGCRFSLESGWGGPAGFVGVFGRTLPVDLTDVTHFSFWINPDADQSYTLELNLQDDDDGDDRIPPVGDGGDDEFQFDFVVSPTGPGAVSGGGWQRVSIPIDEFYDDNSYHWGGNGVFDPTPVSAGGNGRLIGVVIVVVSPTGGVQTFRTDRWSFENQDLLASDSPPAVTALHVLGPAAPNPFSPRTAIRYELPSGGDASLVVYDARGRLVRTLAIGAHARGAHAVEWDGRNGAGHPVGPGVYFLRLDAGGDRRTMRLVRRP